MGTCGVRTRELDVAWDDAGVSGVERAGERPVCIALAGTQSGQVPATEDEMERDDELYKHVKFTNPMAYQNIVAFASCFGKGDEEISLKTRSQVERFCMSLVRTP